ncbi:hypothetical protein ANRL3_02105 [Anaerolineae bacterium]|nr:hypothetical protein ANRL3_02105 [Anaerolineae bacterium]
MRKPIGFLFVLSSFVLSACATNAHSTYTAAGSLGYQYDEPHMYCRTIRSNVGFEQYCPEGRIEVEFIAASANDSAGMLAAQLSSSAQSDNYLVSTVDSNITVNGQHPTVAFAALKDVALAAQADRPTYIGALSFGTKHIAIVRGFLYKAEFGAEFQPAFRTVALTLQPAGPVP